MGRYTDHSVAFVRRCIRENIGSSSGPPPRFTYGKSIEVQEEKCICPDCGHIMNNEDGGKIDDKTRMER